MFQYVSAVGIVATVMTLLMVVVMLYLVWGALGNSVHTPSPDTGDQPELGEGDAADEPQGELDADEPQGELDSDEPQGDLAADGSSA